jgi:DNA invertase Pin-like site-specific DNA recombinase
MMPPQRFITYARVSTQRQGQSGLGLEAQRYAVAEYLGANRSNVVGEFVEVESGRKNSRPELQKALAACRVHRATLVVARLDRLARNAAFLLTLRDSDVDFVCADMPQANRMTIGILGVVAEAESEAISVRTKAALAAAKRRGAKLGNPQLWKSPEIQRKGRLIANANSHAASVQRAAKLMPIVKELREAGADSYRALADALNARGVPTARGGRWEASHVQRLMEIIDYRPTLREALALIRDELRRRGNFRRRNQLIYYGRLKGRTFQSLGLEYGLSRGRVRDLCHRERLHRKGRRDPAPKPAGEGGLREILEAMLMEGR